LITLGLQNVNIAQFLGRNFLPQPVGKKEWLGIGGVKPVTIEKRGQCLRVHE